MSERPTEPHRHLEPRDVVRTRIAAEFIDGRELTGDAIRDEHYRTTQRSSFHKTFKRDRDALAEQGIHLDESVSGTSKRWSVDDASLADLRALPDADALMLSNLLEPLVRERMTPNPQALGHAVARLGRLAPNGCGIRDELPCDPKVLAAVTSAYAQRVPCELHYQSLAESSPSWRTFSTYGLFELADSMYAVGLREQAGKEPGIRTLNLSRVSEARELEGREHYEIPKGFDVLDYRLLPFELGEETAFSASFYVPRPAASSFRQQARKRGSIEGHRGGSLTWTVSARDTRRAAAWAVEVGILPLSPDSLVSAWTELLEGTLS